MALIKEIPEENEEVKELFYKLEINVLDFFEKVDYDSFEIALNFSELQKDIDSITNLIFAFEIEGIFKNHWRNQLVNLILHFIGKLNLHILEEGSIGDLFDFNNSFLRNIQRGSQKVVNVSSFIIKKYFFFLFKENIPSYLLKDLAEEALTIFPEAEDQLVIQAALNSVEYLEGGKQATFLEKLSPDMAIAVKAIVDDGGLDD